MILEEVFGGNITDPVPDPYTGYERLRREAPCQRFETTFGDMYVVTRYDDVRRILVAPELFGSAINNRLIGLVIGPTIIGMDGAVHLKVRRLVTPAFSPQAVARLAGRIRGIASLAVQEFERRSRVDLVAAFTFTYPLNVIAHLVGVPLRNLAEFHHWARALLTVATNPAEAFAAVAKIRQCLAPAVAAGRAEDGDDLVSALVRAEVEGQRLSDEEVLSFLTLLLQAGAETTSSVLGSALFLALRHGLWSRLRLDRSLIERLFLETLRYESPVQFVARETTAPVTLGGTALPTGAFVVAVLGSANRDPSVFPDADRFDVARPVEQWERTLPFGFGPHYCAGTHLARAEFSAALEALLDRRLYVELDPLEEHEGVVGFAFRAPRQLLVRLSSY
jgi:cytochrome P450